MQQVYDAWPYVAGQLGVSASDLGSALAVYLFGSWMAYNDVIEPDVLFKQVAEQMHHVLARFSDFANLSDADKQLSHEKLVTVGMLVTTTLHELRQNLTP